jgi:hypothetical protein
MTRKSPKRKGSVGAEPGEAPTPGRRTAPHPLRDRPTPARTQVRPAVAAPRAGVVAAGPTTRVTAAVPSALYGRLRGYATDAGTTVEGALLAAIEGFLATRGF